MTVPGNRRVVTLVAGLVVAALAITGAVRACGGAGDSAPPNEALRLMPDETLVYLTLSTDGDREAVRRARDLAERFTSYDRLRDALLQRLSGDDQPVDQARDVAPWAGDEAAFALVDSGQSTAGSLIAIAVTDEEKAREFLERNPREAVRRTYKDHETVRYGTVTTAFVDGFLVIGQDPTVQAAIDRVESDAPALEDDPVYRRATDGLPDGRVLTAYASASGLRRLLVPAGNLLGGISRVLDQPGLEGVALTAEADGEDRLRVRVHSALDPQAQRGREFEPTLVDDVPDGVLGYLGVSGLSGALQNLIVSQAGGAPLERLRRQLEQAAGSAVQEDLLALFDGEVALVLQRQAPAPIVSLIARTEDEAATRRVLDRLRAPLARLLRPEGEPAPEWEPQDIGGSDAWTLRFPNGAGITYAVSRGRLILSTSADGVRAIAGGGDSLEDSDAFREVTESRPDRVGTLGFLDFSQLLELGEQTGLNDSREYLAVRDDLRRVRALGVSSSSREGESTAEILVSIP